MKKIFLMITVFSFLFSLENSFSQEDILRPKGKKIIGNQANTTNNDNFKRNAFIIGLEGGLNFNMYSSSKSYSPALPDPAGMVTNSGTGLSAYAGLNVGYEINDKFALHFRLNYDQKYFKNTKEGDIDISDANGVYLQTGREKQGYDFTIDYLHLALDLRYNFTKNLFGTVGLFYQSQLGKAVVNVDYYMLTPDAWYNYGTFNPTELHFSDSSSTLPTRTGIELGLGYKYEISHKMYLVPQIRYQYSFSKFDSDGQITDETRSATIGTSTVNTTNQALNSLQFGLGLWFEL